ncbi:hypothetical protein XAC439_12100006 [Xanthomonas citri pv. citri]|nr:hypothetical protein XAC439_12100006 [Xanthomonas citri pv. citri]
MADAIHMRRVIFVSKDCWACA